MQRVGYRFLTSVRSFATANRTIGLQNLVSDKVLETSLLGRKCLKLNSGLQLEQFSLLSKLKQLESAALPSAALPKLKTSIVPKISFPCQKRSYAKDSCKEKKQTKKSPCKSKSPCKKKMKSGRLSDADAKKQALKKMQEACKSIEGACKTMKDLKNKQMEMKKMKKAEKEKGGCEKKKTKRRMKTGKPAEENENAGDKKTGKNSEECEAAKMEEACNKMRDACTNIMPKGTKSGKKCKSGKNKK